MERFFRTRKAVELAPGNHAFLDTLGWLLYLSGDTPASTHYHFGVAAASQ